MNLNSTSDEGHDSHIADYYPQDKNTDIEEKKCVICCLGGKLLCCAGRGCSRSYHLSCVNPPFTFDQLGVWHCVWCVKKKMEMDVYSVSEGIESVLDSMETQDDSGKQKQYLVKYKGLAHVHNRWISERDLKLQAPSIFARFRKRNQAYLWKKDWSVPQRILAKRLLLFPNDSNNSFTKWDGCHYEWLVKWKGLDYNHATWELESAPFLMTHDSLMLIYDFENRHMKEKEESNHHEITKERRIHLAQLEDLSSGCPENLFYVNKLLEWWKRPQNALIIDEQDRFVKVVLFLSSLLKETKGPFLILTISTALPLWEDEFQQWASRANVIVYNGSKENRSCIRSLELFDEDQGITCHILLAHHRAFVEDLDYFKHVKWEVVLIDECQRPSVLEHPELLIMLATNMRLLLASNEIRGWSFNYHGALSLLDSEYIAMEDMNEGDPKIDKPKERMAQFTAYECKRETIEFAEFWVPVMLTDVQIEQYCASLFSKSFLLCSCTKTDSPVSLHDLLLSVKKTCDHPFLVDYSLRSLVLQDVPEADQFDTEIQQSGKLQLLDKLLSEIKHQGLRVLVYFQAMGGPGIISVGDILDDFIHQKLGRDSYARIDGNMSRLKKKAALDRFNCKEKSLFVCLMEARACIPSIKVASIDAIFVYNSDWDPINDLRALQKLTIINSQLEQLKVFRLYSSCTVEEKVLIQAKEGLTVDSNIRNIKKTTCHKLLTWGASILFSKFDASSEHRDDPSKSNNCSEDTLLEDVFQELLCLLLPSSKSSTSSSVVRNRPVNVVQVQPDRGSYLCVHSLSGESIADSADNYSIVRHLMDNEPASLFWTNLLDRRQPKWRYMPSQPPRVKNKVLYLEGLPEGSERNTSDTINGSKEATITVSHMGKYKPDSQSKLTAGNSQHSATKRRRSVHNLLYDQVARHRKKKVKTLKGNGCDAHQAASPSVHNVVNDKAPRGRKKKIKTPEGNGCDAHQAVCLSVHNLVNDKAPRRRKKKIKTLEGNGCDPNQAVCPSIMEVPSSNGLSGGTVGCPPGTPGSLASELSHVPLASSPVEGTIEVLPSMHSENRSFVQASRQEAIGASQPALSSPLDAEIQTMKEAKEKAINFHENLKLQIESERRKELEEVNKKFDVEVQKAEWALVETTTRLESRCTTLNEQKLLAEAMLQKHSYAFTTWSDHQRDAVTAYIREIHRLFSPGKDSDACEPGPGDNNAASEPNANAVAVMTSNETAQPLIPRVSVPSRFCAQRGRAVRAPAPHLRNSTIRPTPTLNLLLKGEDSSGFFRHSPNLSNDAILQ